MYITIGTPKKRRLLLRVVCVAALSSACASTSAPRERALLEVFGEQMDKFDMEAVRPPRATQTFDAGRILTASGGVGSYIWEYCQSPVLPIAWSESVELSKMATVAVKQSSASEGGLVGLSLTADGVSDATERVNIQLEDTKIRSAPDAAIKALIRGGCSSLPWNGEKIEFVQEVLTGRFRLKFEDRLRDTQRLKVGALVFNTEARRDEARSEKGTYQASSPVVVGYKRGCVESKRWRVFGWEEMLVEVGLPALAAGVVFGVISAMAAGDFDDRCRSLGGTCGGDPVADYYADRRDTTLPLAISLGAAGAAATAAGLTSWLLPECP